jgi:hypothetical protein
MQAQPAVALVVGIAELLADDRGERAARDQAARRPGLRRRRNSHEVLQRWPIRAAPVAVVRVTEPAGVRRAPTAGNDACRHR